MNFKIRNAVKFMFAIIFIFCARARGGTLPDYDDFRHQMLGKVQSFSEEDLYISMTETAMLSVVLRSQFMNVEFCLPHNLQHRYDIFQSEDFYMYFSGFI